MPSIKINTDHVVNVANLISGYNKDLRNEFQDVESAMHTLQNNWTSPSANNAISRFNEIKSNYKENRYKVMQNYVNFLLQQVGAGYENTEEVNKSLAAAFK